MASVARLVTGARKMDWARPPDIGLAGRQAEGAGAIGPGTVQVVGAGLAVAADAHLVEVGERLVVLAHDRVHAGDAGLVGEGLDVGQPAPAVEQYLDRLAGAQVAAPAERRADQQV